MNREIKLPDTKGIPTTTDQPVAPAAFHIMLKPRGPICNLDCQYCYYLSKERLYPGSRFHMRNGLLEEYTRQYIAAQRVPEVTFCWQGGEPTLMRLDFFRLAVKYQQKYGKLGMRIHNALQTNGMTLDDNWCRFFKKHNFLVGLSIDGPYELHDAYRVDKGGKPTFSRVMDGLALLKKHSVEFNILTTVHTANADYPLQVYRFLRDEVGTRFMQFIPIVERDNETGFQEGNKVTERSVTGQHYGDFLIAIFDEWVRRDVGRIFVQMFDVALGAWMGQPGGLCVFAETCGNALAMEHNGDLYSCDHFVEPRHLLGNIKETHMIELVASDKQCAFGEAKRDTLPHYCRECEVRFACHGGCPKNRFIETPDGEPGLNYLCQGYKSFFNHVHTPMKMMALLYRSGRPPADIMRVMAREDAKHFSS
ncbi:MAG: anaerobic sulfatase maturase [Candidatus Hydrogenedentota bacterium]|nr:MAG: anaerobic sulfatase maturase [Candidatus Hydrogenedentota bacterium]